MYCNSDHHVCIFKKNIFFLVKNKIGTIMQFAKQFVGNKDF